ncbi:MAG: NADH-quinone oxidoreductase subunit H [Deltaproteobacteria bacterium]|nr:NADH-quinone oxidoreductase subunit H [Deltaproteobacteria bacterium]
MLLVFPPFFMGVIAKTKAFFAGRKGPSLFQMYYDLWRLLRKSAVYSRSSSLVLRWAPSIILSALFFSGLFLPFQGQALFHFEGDILLFAYLLALARFLTLLAAMDVGSSFEGMGASREATFGALSELAFFLGLIVLAMVTHSTSLTEILGWNRNHSLLQPALLFLFAAFFLILLTENSRMPIDDPTTHLELTMIHEVMILDYSGPDLALILYGASMKLWIFAVWATSLLWPSMGSSLGGAMGFLFLKGIGMAIAIGVVESTLARFRLIKIPQILIANFVLVAFALLIVLFHKQG